MEYGGVRLKTAVFLEGARILVTIDIGFEGAMADATQHLDYPTLRDLPASQVRSYLPASVIAEKRDCDCFGAPTGALVWNGR